MIIERNIPLPSAGKIGQPSKYNFHEFTVVGYSAIMSKDPKEYSRITCAAYNYARRYNMKFSVRTTKEGLRLWRTS
jgi:hypothetical protein